MALISIDQSYGVTITNVKCSNSDAVIHSKDSRFIRISGVEANSCEKGVILENCWDAEVNNVNITTSNSSLFRKNLLASTIPMLMLMKKK
ncbi:hypothetical protein [Acinetobacter sp. NigerLNRRAM0016]